MNLDQDSPIVRQWLDEPKDPKRRERRAGALARFHGLVIYACFEAKKDRVPLMVIERILRGLGDPCKRVLKEVEPRERR